VLPAHITNLPCKSGVPCVPLHIAQPVGIVSEFHIAIVFAGIPLEDNKDESDVLTKNILADAGRYTLLFCAFKEPVIVKLLFVVKLVDTEMSVVFGNVILLFAKYFLDIINFFYIM
jgi:hypothetical protein